MRKHIYLIKCTSEKQMKRRKLYELRKPNECVGVEKMREMVMEGGANELQNEGGGVRVFPYEKGGGACLVGRNKGAF